MKIVGERDMLRKEVARLERVKLMTDWQKRLRRYTLRGNTTDTALRVLADTRKCEHCGGSGIFPNISEYCWECVGTGYEQEHGEARTEARERLRQATFRFCPKRDSHDCMLSHHYASDRSDGHEPGR
jgi:hypothetical protein